MQNTKRVEIITGAYDMREVIRLLEIAGSDGYTLIPEVKGKGERGDRNADGLTEAFKNSMLIWVCTEQQWNDLREPLRLFVQRVGGMVIVSDCTILQH